MGDRDETRAPNGTAIKNRRIVSDKTVEALVNEVIRKIMRDHPQMCAGDAAVGLLDGAIFVASRLPGVNWDEISHFLKTITEVIESRTEAQIEAHYGYSQLVN